MSKDKKVHLIEDPFGIKTQDIADAQQSSDELIIDEELTEIVVEESDEAEETQIIEASAEIAEESEADLDRLTQALAEEQAKQERELAETASAMDSSALLAAQIAEDEALAKEMAEQAEKDEMDPELRAALPKEPQPDEDGNLDLNELVSCIETLLFLSDKPVSATKLRELLGPEMKLSLFQEALDALQDKYKASFHGIEVVEIGGGFQFRTKPGRAPLARKLAKVQTQRLSSGAMETLAIVAYKQPVLKDDVDKIRGVDSSYFVHGLLEKKLIRISGRSELPGRPMLYSTTDEFLQLFGLADLSAMPSLRELEQMIPTSQSTNPEEEDPRVKEMRRLVSQMKADSSTSLKYDPREDEKILREIRERVNSIPTSTPYIDEQKALEKQAAAQPAPAPTDLLEVAAAAEAAVVAATAEPVPAEIEPSPTTDGAPESIQ